jgi:hypothetical protein
VNTFAKAAAIAVVVLLSCFFVYALATGDIVGDCLHTWQVVWGVYVWADAYSGFILMSTLIYAYERKLWLVLILFAITCWTGNMVNAAWLLWRAPDIYARIARRPTP